MTSERKSPVGPAGVSIVSWHKRQVRLRVAPKSLKACLSKLLPLLKRLRGQSLTTTTRNLNQLLRGWVNYYRLTASKRSAEVLDGWVAAVSWQVPR